MEYYEKIGLRNLYSFAFSFIFTFKVRNLKNLYLLFITFLLGLALVGVSPVLAQETTEEEKPTETKPAAPGKVKPYEPPLGVEELKEDVLDSFEVPDDWRAIGTSPHGESRTRKIPGAPKELKGKAEEKPKEGTPPAEGTQPKEKAAHKFCLGVRTYFADKGFDRVEVLPPNEYVIKGKLKSIRIWVLGRKFKHTLLIRLRDYRGKLHTFEVGNLDFYGWQELNITIPGWVPQSTRYALLDQNLRFHSFVVQSNKFESGGFFYTYFDQLTITTDISAQKYDGAEIQDNW